MNYLVKYFGTLALLIAAVTGCSTVSVESDHLAGVDFTSFKTYRWHAPNEFNKNSAEYLQNDILDKRIRKNVGDVLEAKGYVLKEDGAVDFLVNFSITTEERMDVQSYNNYGGYAPGYGYGGYYRRGNHYSGVGFSMSTGTETRTSYYTQGTFIVDIVRPVDDKLIWRGTAEGKIQSNKNKTATDREKTAHEVSVAILADFPPQP